MKTNLIFPTGAGQDPQNAKYSLKGLVKSLRLFNTLLFIVTVICFSSCMEAGPEGPQGSQGEKGEQGPQGIPGAAGSTIFSGEGEPVADMGKAGDYYLNKSTAEIYGPKSDEGWDAPTNLKGQQGEKGKDGSRILSGSAKPSSAVGKEGDYYWDTNSHTLYGPKASSGWGNGVILSGAKGPKGDPGEKGEQGEKGEKGDPGIKGEQGDTGVRGDRGEKGDKGDTGNANVISSGWMTIPSEDWRDLPSVGQYNPGTINFTESGELDWLVNYPKGYPIDAANTTGAILMYVDNGGYYGIKLAPFQLPVSSIVAGRGVQGSLIYRFSIQKTSDGYHLYPVVALRSGQWNRDGFIKNTFLPDKKWRVIMIPVDANARQAPPPDPRDYLATCEYYGIVP